MGRRRAGAAVGAVGAALGLATLAGCGREIGSGPVAAAKRPVALIGRRTGPLTWKKLAGSPTGGYVGLSFSAHAQGERYIYAGAMPDDAPGRLFRFDLDRNRWEEIPTTSWPIGKYRHFVLDRLKNRLIVHWDGLGQAYAVSTRGGAWHPVGSSANSEEYYEAYLFWNPRTQAMNVFGGYGSSTMKNTLWEHGPSGEWHPVATRGPAPSPRLGGRAIAVDEVWGKVYLGEESGGDDLWELDLGTRTWRQLLGLNQSAHRRHGSGMTVTYPLAHELLRFGGKDVAMTDPPSFRDVLVYDLRKKGDWVQLETRGTPPEPRVSPGVFFDSRHGRVIVLGGIGVNGYFDDVWELSYPNPWSR